MKSLAVLIAINTKVLFHVWRYGDLTAIACIRFNFQVIFSTTPTLLLSFSLHAAVPFGLSHQQDKRKKLLSSKKTKHQKLIDSYKSGRNIYTKSYWLILTIELMPYLTNRSYSDLIWFDSVRLHGLNQSLKYLVCDAAWITILMDFFSHFIPFLFLVLALKSAWIKNILCDYVKENTLLLNMMYGHGHC